MAESKTAETETSFSSAWFQSFFLKEWSRVTVIILLAFVYLIHYLTSNASGLGKFGAACWNNGNNSA